jgi:hypothetical protein
MATLTLAEAAEFFCASAARLEPELSVVVETICTRGAVAARELIGHEQDGWPPLSGATVYGFRHPRAGWITGRLELGYGGFESPLLRTGSMRDSVSFVASGLVGEVGSDDKRALFNELGTPSAEFPTPPRPFISKGLLEAVETGYEELAVEVARSLLVPV